MGQIEELEATVRRYQAENEKLRKAAVSAIKGLIPWALMEVVVPKGDALVTSLEAPASQSWTFNQSTRDVISGALKGLSKAIYPEGFPKEEDAL